MQPSAASSCAPSFGWPGRRGFAPIGGTTLLVLVTMVLATGQRDSLSERQSPAETRWVDPATQRSTRVSSVHPTSPTKPVAAKFVGLGGAGEGVQARTFAEDVATAAFAPILIPTLHPVRVALMNLPPP